MLGRLRMSVTEAIELYETLVETVFADVKVIGGHSKFKATKLEAVIKKIVTERTGHADERMMDTREGEVCKTYVLEICRICRTADLPQVCLCDGCAELESRNPASLSHLSSA